MRLKNSRNLLAIALLVIVAVGAFLLSSGSKSPSNSSSPAATERSLQSVTAALQHPPKHYTRYPVREITDLPQRCKREAAHKSRLEAPIIYRRQSSYIAVLYIDKPDDYAFFCSWSANPYLPPRYQDQISGGDNQWAVPQRHSFEGIAAAPPAVGIEDSQGGDAICDTPPNPNLGEMYGFAGKDVAGATFHFAHDPPIKAVVERGFYIASWPYASWPDAVALKTTTGTTVTRHVPPRGCSIPPDTGVAHRPKSGDGSGAVVLVVVRTRDGSAKRATTFTTRGAAEISPSGVEQTSVDTTSFMDRGFEAMSSGNDEAIYDPTNNTVYETNQNAELAASMQQLTQTETKLRQRLKSSHPNTQASQRTTTINITPSSKQYGSFVAASEPGLDGLSDMFVPHVGRRERVVARVTIDGHRALKLAQAWYMTDMGAMGEVGGYGTMYVTPGSREPVRDVLPNGDDAVTNNWLSYRVLPATPANLKLVSLTALHPGARVSHSAAGFLRAQNDATN